MEILNSLYVDFIESVKQKILGGLSQMSSETKLKFKDPTIIYEGEKIILPMGMDLKEAAIWIERRMVEEEREVAISEAIDAYPLDGAVAFATVLENRFGFTSLEKTPGFFGPTPPTMVGVKVGYVKGRMKTRQVPWGSVKVPGIDGILTTGFMANSQNQPRFLLSGKIKRKSEALAHNIAEDVRQEVRDNSIYRGKPIKVYFRTTDGEPKRFDPAEAPEYMDLSGVIESDLILSAKAEMLIEASLFTPIQFSSRFRKFGIGLGRGVLLEGPFGTGKTLTAYVLAKKCEENGWTFLYVSNIRDLPDAISFAKVYQPCVIFGEDIDRITSGERDDELSQLMNLLDGIDTKKTDIITVLTTNNVELMFPGVLRAGRIDIIIPIAPPDINATLRLLRRYGGEYLKATDEELIKVCQPLVGHNAAFVEQAIIRAKSFSAANSDESMIITATDLGVAVETMIDHLKLITPKQITPESIPEKFVEYQGAKIADRLRDVIFETLK